MNEYVLVSAFACVTVYETIADFLAERETVVDVAHTNRQEIDGKTKEMRNIRRNKAFAIRWRPSCVNTRYASTIVLSIVSAIRAHLCKW